jgi:hypothetical protein
MIDNIRLSAILFILAVAIFNLYLLRRKDRKQTRELAIESLMQFFGRSRVERVEEDDKAA